MEKVFEQLLTMTSYINMHVCDHHESIRSRTRRTFPKSDIGGLLVAECYYIRLKKIHVIIIIIQPGSFLHNEKVTLRSFIRWRHPYLSEHGLFASQFHMLE